MDLYRRKVEPIRFRATALNDLRRLPDDARHEAGHQLYRVQCGLDPDDWKPMSSIGSGVREIRVRDETGAFRVIYIASIGEAVHVLHVFQKKTQRTPRHDLDLARDRLRELRKEFR
jgi:phage-related protein